MSHLSLWYVYVLLGTGREIYYTGCTNDFERRLRQHNGELGGGAKFTRRSRPWRPARLYGPFPDRGSAQSFEAKVKKLRGSKKLHLPG